jgi:hypothetical protein
MSDLSDLHSNRAPAADALALVLRPLDNAYGEVLQMPRAERPARREELCREADGFLGQWIEDTLKPEWFTDDPEKISEEKAVILEAMCQYRHLFGGKDRFGLETLLRERFMQRALVFLAEELPDMHATPSDPNALVLECSTPDCPFRVVAPPRKASQEGDDDALYMVCPVCMKRRCWRCGSSGEHVNCADYAMVRKALGKSGSDCPNCGTFVSKHKGCDRMKCPNPTCRRQWEWTTGATGKDLSVEHRWADEPQD